MGNIYAKDITLGQNCHIDSDIGTKTKPLDRVVIGDNVYIGSDCVINVPSLQIGDYTKIHRQTLVYGRNPLMIGHNCWVGEGSVIDAEGQTYIGNNAGIGAHSQLWSHVRHGDLMMGCTLYGFNKLTIEDDVWFVGHCVVSPIHAAPFSIALVGSIVTKDMEANTVYAGVPAKKLREPAYNETTIDYRMYMMLTRLHHFSGKDPVDGEFGELEVVETFPEVPESGVSYFNVANREYIKTGSSIEQAFMKYLLPEIKFVPRRLP